MRNILLILCCLQLSACSRDTEPTEAKPTPPQNTASRPAEPGPAQPVLSWNGYGPVNFGSSLADVEKAAGKSAPLGHEEPACHYVRFTSLTDALFMVENGRITRADVEPGVPNDLGIAVGDDFAAIQQKYPGAKVEPHKYVDGGHYLIISSPDDAKAMVLEENAGKITEIRAGVKPAVRYIEGCS